MFCIIYDYCFSIQFGSSGRQPLNPILYYLHAQLERGKVVGYGVNVSESLVALSM